MNIQKERELFNKYIKETHGHNVLWHDDNPIAALDLMMWNLWLAAKQQTVPEGCVAVNKRDLAKVLNCVTDDWLIDTNSMDEFNKVEMLVLDEVKSMIQESQK